MHSTAREHQYRLPSCWVNLARSSRHKDTNHGPWDPSAQLCIRSFAAGLAAGRLELLEDAIWVPCEFIQKVLLCAVEASPHTMTDETLLGIMAFDGSLTELYANGCTAVTDKTIRAACSMCHMLRFVDLRRTAISEQVLTS
jgi:hypothetical protein